MSHDPQPVAIDDMTGFKVAHSALKRQWDGAWTVDPDRRNPQDLIRSRPERSGVPHPRPEATDAFLAENIYDENGVPLLTEDGLAILGEGQLNGTGL